MDDSVNIPLLIEMSLSMDQDQIQQATGQLTQVLENPESIQLFLQYFESDGFLEYKNKFLIYIYKIIEKHWNSYDDGTKGVLIEKFESYAKVPLDTEITRSLANIFSLLFSLTKQNAILDVALFSGNNELIFFLFARCGSDFPEELIANNIGKFVELGQWGFAQPSYSHFDGSADIFMNILEITQDHEIFDPVCQFVIDVLPHEPEIEDDTIKRTYWALVDQLFVYKLLPIEAFSQFMVGISQSLVKSYAIYLFADIVDDLEKEQLIELLQLNVEVLADIIEKDGTIPEDCFEIFYNTVASRCERQLVIDIINALLQGDESHQCTGIYLLHPLIQAAPVTVSEEVSFINECLQNALKSPLKAFNEAALRVMDNFEDTGTELTSVFPALIELISPFLSSSDSAICSLAYGAITTLLEEADCEIEDLLPKVWNLLSNDQVSEDMLPSFMEVLSILIGHTEELDDDIVDAILEWLDGLFENEDISLRASALSIIAELIKSEESMCDSLLPFCQQTVGEVLSSDLGDESQQATINAFEFLKTIAVSFKERSVEIITPFLENLAGALTIDKYKMNAADTISIYTGYSGDETMLDEQVNLIPVVEEFLKSDFLMEQKCGCMCITSLSHVLTKNPISLDFYKLVLEILVVKTEQELICQAFRAAKSLYKRCRSVDEENESQFIQLTYVFLEKLMSGDIAYLEGVSPSETPKMEAIVQDAMEFFGVFFKSNPENVTPICESLVEWMKGADEISIFPIIGALVDALEFCQIEESIPIEMCVFVQSSANEIKDPDLQQNVAYFLGVLCRMFPQQVELVHQVLPCVVNWWQRALAKKTGFQDVLSNIASFFLSYILLNQELADELVIGALRQFPPSDLPETETMCLSMASILEKLEVSKNIMIEIAVAFSRLFIESQAQIESRKISQEAFEHSVMAFKNLMQDEQIQNVVFEKYEKRKAKKQQLVDLLSQ